MSADNKKAMPLTPLIRGEGPKRNFKMLKRENPSDRAIHDALTDQLFSDAEAKDTAERERDEAQQRAATAAAKLEPMRRGGVKGRQGQRVKAIRAHILEIRTNHPKLPRTRFWEKRDRAIVGKMRERTFYEKHVLKVITDDAQK
jgi:hypothetical protein